MLLVLLRHAEAEPPRTDDASRHLTEKGIGQAKRMGDFLVSSGLDPDLILTSPVVRARETAEIVAGKLGGTKPVEAPWLACGMRPDVALRELGAFHRFDSLMIVGHEPDFSALIATLLDMRNSNSVNISKASLTGIELPRMSARAGILKFLLPVKLLP